MEESLAYNLHCPKCHRESEAAICCHYWPLISEEPAVKWIVSYDNGNRECGNLNVANVGATSSSQAFFRPAEGRRVCSPPVPQVGGDPRLEEVFPSYSRWPEGFRRVQLAFVCLNSFDDTASGELQESPQVRSSTFDSVAPVYCLFLPRLFPLLIALSSGTSRPYIPSRCSSLSPRQGRWVVQILTALFLNWWITFVLLCVNLYV